MTHHAHANPAHKDNSLDRLLFFSDGVFAIAITLLAIELHKPETWNGRAADLWAHDAPVYASFLLSFLVVGILWNAHRRLFTLVNRFSEGVFFLNLGTLGAIALMPFATTLLWARDVEANEGVLVYLALVGLTGVFQALTYGLAAMTGAVAPVPWPRRVVAFLMFALTPALASSLSIMLFARPPQWGLVAVTGCALVVLSVARAWTARRYGR